MSQPSIDELFMQAVGHHQAGRLGPAEATFRQILDQQADYAPALNGLGVIHFTTGRRESGLLLLRNAILIKDDYADCHYNLARMLHTLGRFDEAAIEAQRAVQLRPDYAEALNLLGNLKQDQGKLDEAIAAFGKTTELCPQSANTFYNFANALREKKDYQNAIPAYQKALQLRPDFFEAYVNLGLAYQSNGQTDEAIQTFERTAELRPQDAEIIANLGNAFWDRGEIDRALACFQRALTVQPQLTAMHSSKLFTLNYLPGQDWRSSLAEHKKWNRQYAEPLKKEIRPHTNNRNPDRKLRIGYVSPDFRDHCQAFFTVPLFSHHDRRNFEIYGYSNATKPDSITPRIQQYANVWKNTAGLKDEQLAELIRADQIDILVDLTMHMSGGRPLMFARKPAPIQIAWLAYPGTTGLTAMDYRLSDPYLDPPGTDERYTEKTIRLPHTFWCYDPQDDQPPVNELPALTNGFITFGCLNTFLKIHDGLLAIWSRVLKAVPTSRFLMLAPPGSARQRVTEKLGVDPSRLEFVARQPRPFYLQTYHRIDLGLDTFPVNGHTTSLDSLWMGVPVVSLLGETAISRAGLSQTTNLGLSDQFLGKTVDDFVNLAVQRAGDPQALSQLRSTLRQRLKASPIMDSAKFAADVEIIFRKLWRTWTQS